jgi:hypothetical protein
MQVPRHRVADSNSHPRLQDEEDIDAGSPDIELPYSNSHPRLQDEEVIDAGS